MTKRQNHLSLILYNLRSAYNVGAIFRTADAAGINRIYLIGITPRPVDDFGRPNSQIAKTALGAETTVKWQYYKTIGPVIKRLKFEQTQIVALEQSPQSINYQQLKLTVSTAVIVGAETVGLPQSVLTASDVIIDIPMRGRKESLNVAVAVGVAVYQLLSPDHF